ncbi:MAG: lamin tail domain-containing protein [Bacteroidales bacterium]
MQKILLLILAILIQSFGKAQFVDNFSDGDFTSNPTWSGDAATYKINTAFQLQLNASGEDISVLTAPSSMQQEMEWNFWIKLSFAPSDNNFARVYLSSDQSDLKGPLNGYYLKFGETGSNDAIELVKQSGSNHTVICRGTDGLLAASFALRIKAIRSTGGLWKVLADPSGGVNYQLQASGTDNSFLTGSYIGVYCKYTSSNSTKFYFDDFYSGQVVIDNLPPEVLSVSLSATNKLKITFNEAIQNSSAVDPNNYSVSPGSILPESATHDIADPSVVNLQFTDGFSADVPYSLSISAVKDLAGNVMTTSQFPFAWHKAKSFDLLINEIMADPTPTVNLPDAEYVELYNRSAYPIDLRDWTLILGSSEKPLPQYKIPAGGYLILCDDGSKPLLEAFGPVLDFSSFAITNAGGTVTLKDFDNNVIHSVSYTDDWYKSSYKSEGGWSLELIDPLNPCGEADNWIACNNPAGGTPGKLNSVNAANPDLIEPSISRVGVSDATHLIVWFSESCDSTNMKNAANYSIDNGIGNPIAVFVQSPDFKVVYLTLSAALSVDVVYTINASINITDCAGNQLLTNTSAQFAIPTEASNNDIIINELLFDPPNGCVDFVEIYNRSSKVIDLKSLVLANYDTLNMVITDYNEITDQPFLILPEMYLVLTTDSSAIKKYFKTPNQQGFLNMATFPTMNNEDGIVALTTKSGEVIDLVTYNTAMHYPLLKNVDGVSLERISSEMPSKAVTNWHSAAEAVGFATPAYKNSQFSMVLSVENEITLSPEIFSPDNDGHNDNLTISYSFGNPGNNITITVYDATGHTIRNLINHELCGTSGAYTWDGITNERQKASIGRYIVFVEIFDLQGQTKRYKKTTVLGGTL